jgi:Holliday junction resolvase RusA-like endonuclease
MKTIPIKALSTNKLWRGRRFPTKEYTKYTATLKMMLPPMRVGEAPYGLDLVFGYSTKLADLSNGIKGFEDALCKKYGFDDRDIYEMNIKKKIVKKGEEYISFSLYSLVDRQGNV